MFDGNEGKEVTIEEAKKYIKSYKMSSIPGATKADFFGKEKLNRILVQKNCVGVRFYYGRRENGNLNSVAVGCDKDGEDLFEGVILEMSEPCPPYCATISPLK